MITKVSKGIVMGALGIWLLAIASYAEEAKRPITLAVLPCTDAVKTFKNFYPLVKYLKQETSLDIKLITNLPFLMSYGLLILMKGR